MNTTRKIIRAAAATTLAIAALLVMASPAALTGPAAQPEAIGHISNGSGTVETDVAKLTISGLVGRFSQTEVRPGDREILAIAVAVCDAGTIANTNVALLPDIVSGTPSIAGGLAAFPCISIGGSDGLHTGINGAVLTFSGPLAQHMGTVRMYADLDFDGRLFEGGDLIQQTVPMLQSNGEVIAQFGRGQGQFLSTSGGQPLIAPDLPAIITALGAVPMGLSAPRIILFTVDVSTTSPGGRVEVALGLQVGDDTAQGPAGFCAMAFGGFGINFNCGSNIRGGGPETAFFDVVGSGGGAVPPPPPPGGGGGGGGGGGSGGSTLASYDSNGNCSLDNPEFFSLVDAWLSETISDSVFFSGIDAWVSESNICTASASSAIQNSAPEHAVSATQSVSGNAVTFRVSGQSVTSTAVEVYSLDGQRVFAGQAAGSQLTWKLGSPSGQIANGVYLYYVRSENADGNVVQSELKRLLVLR